MILNQERRGERANECISTGKRDEILHKALMVFEPLVLESREKLEKNPSMERHSGEVGFSGVRKEAF